MTKHTELTYHETCLVFGVIDALFQRVDEKAIEIPVDPDTAAAIAKVRRLVYRLERDSTGMYAMSIAPFTVEPPPL